MSGLDTLLPKKGTQPTPPSIIPRTAFDPPPNADKLFAPPSTAQATADADRQKDREREAYGWGQFIQHTASYDWATTRWLLSEEIPPADLDWEPSEAEFDEARKRVPPWLHDRLYDAHSAQHLQWLIPRLKDEDAAISRLENMSGWGQSGRIALSMLDPVELGASIVAEGITLGTATPLLVAKYGLKGKNAARLVGGASNAAVGVGINAAHGEDDPLDYGLGMAMDFGLGALMAPRFARAARAQAQDIRSGVAGTLEVQKRMSEEYSRLLEQADSALEGTASVGAAQAPKEALSQGVTLTPELNQGDVPVRAFGGARMSAVGKAVTSDSPIERALAPHLGEDAVGSVDGSKTPISAAEWASQNHQRVEADWKRTVDTAWEGWAKSQGIGLMGRKMPKEEHWQRFSSQVVDYVEDARPNAETLYHPEVVKAGKKARLVFADFAEDLRNPGRQEGATLRPLAGAENLTPDPHYVPRIADREAIDQMIARFGESTVKRLVKEALRSGLEKEQRVVDDGLLNTISEGYYQNISSAAYGMTDDLGEALSGRSASRLRSSLAGAGIDPEAVERIVLALHSTDASTPRLKYRSPIDYNYTVNTPQGPLSMRDMFSRDIDHVAMAYSRRMSGEIALGRMRVKDPSQPDHPDFWIDGITSRAEFEEKVVKAIRDDHYRRKLGSEKTEQAVKRAEFLYRAVLGLPQHEMSSSTARKLRRLRDYNFLRLMNNMGITQAVEIARVFSMTGLRAALSNMPSLKRIVEQGSSDPVLANKMARELEMWGVTDNDYWIGASKYRFQEELIGETPVSEPGAIAKLGQKYDDAVKRGKEILANTSLQRPVHSRLQQWAARATVQWFADNARDPANFVKYAARIADMGLDRSDLDAISAQISNWAEAQDSTMKKITTMNFDKWEPEARSQFLHAVRRYTNRIVQKNEAGNLPMFMAHPVAKTFLQFRTFSFAAYEKSTLWNLKHRDQQAMMIALGDVAFGAGLYALRAHARAAGREDREEFLEKELEPGHLAAMGFAISGIASIAPMFIDLGLTSTPIGPVFSNVRSSGSAMDAVGGSAVVDLFNGVAGASKAATSTLWEGREMTQQELKGLLRTAPFGNHLAAQGLLESLTNDRH